MEQLQVSRAEAVCDTVRISVFGVSDEPGTAFALFHCLANHSINVDMIIQSVGKEGRKDIVFTVDHYNADETMRLLNENKEQFGAERVEREDHVTKLFIEGSEMNSNPGIAAKMFEALFSVGVNIKLISTAETRITVLIDEGDTERAYNSVKSFFGLEKP